MNLIWKIMFYLLITDRCEKVFGSGNLCHRLTTPDKNKYGGSYLNSHSYTWSSQNTVSGCAKTCKAQRHCKSFHYHTVNKYCFLNRESHVTYPRDMKTDNSGQTLYFLPDDWPEEISGPCAFHSCSEEEICEVRPISSGTSYACVHNPDYCIWQTGCSTCVSQNVTTTVNLEVSGITTDIPVSYQPISCMATNSSRSNYGVYINLRSEIDWFDFDKTTIKCAALAVSGNYSFFGIEFYAECWLTNTNLTTIWNPIPVSRCDKKCQSGVGIERTVFFYKVS